MLNISCSVDQAILYRMKTILVAYSYAGALLVEVNIVHGLICKGTKSTIYTKDFAIDMLNKHFNPIPLGLFLEPVTPGLGSI